MKTRIVIASLSAVLIAAAPALAQVEFERVSAIDPGAWWARWLALVLIGGVVSAICFKNPKRGHDQ